jgi:hypothetical protein
MIGKNSCFSITALSITTGFFLFLFTFLAYSHASAQTELTGQLIAKSNNTILNDPLRNAILTFSDGTSILDLDGVSDLPIDTAVITTSDTTDSSDQSTATTSDTTDSSDQSTATTSDSNLSRTTSLDSDNRDTSGEVGSTSGEVGSTTGEVGTSTGELHSATGEVGS